MVACTHTRTHTHPRRHTHTAQHLSTASRVAWRKSYSKACSPTHTHTHLQQSITVENQPIDATCVDRRRANSGRSLAMVSQEHFACLEQYLSSNSDLLRAEGGSSLLAILSRGQRQKDAERAKNFKFLRTQQYLFDAEQQSRFQALEAQICNAEHQKQKSVDAFCEWLIEHAAELRDFAQPSLEALGNLHAAKANPNIQKHNQASVAR